VCCTRLREWPAGHDRMGGVLCAQQLNPVLRDWCASCMVSAAVLGEYGHGRVC
jgi:hypothetical protein